MIKCFNERIGCSEGVSGSLRQFLIESFSDSDILTIFYISTLNCFYLVYTWQNLGTRLFNVLPSSAENVTNTHFEKFYLEMDS